MTLKEKLMALADAYADEATSYKSMCFNGYEVQKPLEARAELLAAVQDVCRDAESWRKYKERKDAAIAAGMNKNPLRYAAMKESTS
jgi:hypothetical protein